jgi:cyclic pyranopterin phosphate synthase
LSGLYDSFQRPINYLRISVTDRCNLRCIYCMPIGGIESITHDQILRYEEIYLVAQAAAKLGITKLRLTGGEPLVRSNLATLIRMLAQIEGIDDISLTTNGVLLKHYAFALKQAGLNRVNISIDSLQERKFRRITRLGTVNDVLEGMSAAHQAGLEPVKINTVVLRGINDDEIIDFAQKTIDEGWHVRFIELIPIGQGQRRKWFVPISEVRARIGELGTLEPCPLSGNGPAKYFRLPDSRGTIGFISPVTEHFCIRCNRLRLTADGKLRPCLLSDEEIDLREPLRGGASSEQISHLIQEAVASKPQGHQLAKGITSKKQAMAQIGG